MEQVKEIVIHMMSVKVAFYVDQTIVQPHLVMTQKLIAAIPTPIDGSYKYIGKLDHINL